MSNNHQKQRMKLRIREQGGQIKHLEAMNRQLIMRLNTMTFKQYKQYAVAMGCIHEQTMLGDLPEEHAGALMLAMTDTWDFSCE